MPVPAGEGDVFSTTPPTGAYASQQDLADAGLDPIPDNADLLLQRASRQIDRALFTAVYDITDTDVVTALQQATVEQVLGTLAGGDSAGLGVATQVSQFTIGKLSATKQLGSTSGGSSGAPTTGGIVDQAWIILQTAGLTGHAAWAL